MDPANDIATLSRLRAIRTAEERGDSSSPGAPASWGNNSLRNSSGEVITSFTANEKKLAHTRIIIIV
ncbi:hypothetical protein JYU34_021662 [Plutella xylostella]|uniref:Uncharacterized protein n=1 Tax=Plutella xylostella TaxID=51655 RepID=A0ABQ7PR60_PLUXY|nr:hypothetical protein JYU34_021662 [Plutella xylostella]